MRVQVQRCRTCGALGVGPNKIKLHPFEGYLYCSEDFRDALQWHEQREHVVGGVKRMVTTDEAIKLIRRYGRKPAVVRVSNWTPYIWDLCAMAEFGLLRGDRRTFVHYFARAVWAWALKEGT